MHSSHFLNSLRSPVHPSWSGFLQTEILEELIRIERHILDNGKEFLPTAQHALRFLELPLQNTRVVILGQDPYPQPGAATGRAFEVGTLKKWNETFANTSLKNIVRGIYQAYTGNTLRFSQIIRQNSPGFRILPPDTLFSSWERQGVLLLNTSFTVEAGNPGSHRRLWGKFTAGLLTCINMAVPGAVWFLWGNHARDITKDLVLKNKYISQHPMMCWDGPGREDDFLFGKINPFRETMEMIDWRGEGSEFRAESGIHEERLLF